MVAGSRSGAKRGQAPLVERDPCAEEAHRPAQQHDPDVERTRRARRAAGRARSRTGRRYAAARARSASSTNGRGASSRRVEVADVGARAVPSASPIDRVVRQPRVGQRGDQVGQRAPRRSAPRCAHRRPRSSRRTAAARGRPIRSNGRRACASGSRQVWWMYSAAPWSMSHGRPCQTSRFGFCGGAVGVGHEGVEPDDVGREVGIDDVARRRRGRVERQRAGQEVHPEVQPAARADQVVDLLVGLGVAERRVELDADEVGHGQADRACQLAGQPLGDEGTRALAGAAELDDVQAVVVRLDEAGQRAALAQGRHVARGDHGPHHAESLAESPRPREPVHDPHARRTIPRRESASTLRA